jgi:hypothetical protein
MSETPLDLTPIRARADAATVGPWTAFEADAKAGAFDRRQWIGVDNMRVDIFSDQDATRDDAKFIAAARTDVPALLAEVDRLRDMVARYEWFAAHPSANAHQRGGERFPSDDNTAPTQVHPDASPEVTDSAFQPKPLACTICQQPFVSTDQLGPRHNNFDMGRDEYMHWPICPSADPEQPKPPVLDEWGRHHEANDARPIGPPFTMGETQEGQS